jgi:membrane protein implicated in regulation of membrane protease activity
MNDWGSDLHWLWLIGGVLLFIAEVIAPGFFLIFIGAAAIATGLLTWTLDLGLPLQLAAFAVLALAAIRVIGRRAYARGRAVSTDPLLNDRAARLVGRSVTVVEAISSSSGRVRVDDGEWNARGASAAVGEQVRITGIDGNCLKVEAEPILPPA